MTLCCYMVKLANSEVIPDMKEKAMLAQLVKAVLATEHKIVG